ncbi:nuclear pore complex protein DDB_G0274915-like isoform X1 [Athalia rosae]|uniref:nuclear pore complex protein DDB_G0274915-like isoform X1 n=2 Tax=Athalia rosae TaxID=37344 RepID=UPI002033B30D|nr:nuclear pore complex protein DDB_G0274915-like isoform X1 [Athalia rosae]
MTTTTCRYFLQGNCRSGRYCRFAHIYNVNYGENSSLGNKPSYTGIKTAALTVAEEVLAIERGGQWLLSCFGPFKERPCIPGMEDLSPDEFHWELYQAQKSGRVEQTKQQFQQLCEEMKAKLALLKNPTSEIVAMLESLQKGTQENAFGGSNSGTKPSSFSFATPQLAIPSTSAPGSNLFTSKPFNSANPFGGSTSTFGSAASTPFAFSNPPNSGISSPFGAKPSFGSNPVFGGTTITPVFGQAPGFNTSQGSSSFGSPQSTQSNAIFGATTTPTNSVFGGTASAPATSSIFGGSQAISTPLFGGATQQPTSSIFGGSSTTGSTPVASASPFAQQKSNTTFGGGPVFGGAPTFGSQANAGIFGAQSTLGSVPTSSSSVFGGVGSVTPTFGSIGQSAPGTFGSVVKSPTSTFGGPQNPPPFGSAVSTSNAGPFASAVSTASSAFLTSTGPFSTATIPSTPFSGSKIFGSMGQSTDTTTAFAKNLTQTSTPFGATNVSATSPFSQASPFAGVSPFSSTSTTVTTTTANPFATQSQVASSSIFGGSSSTNQGSIFATLQSPTAATSPFLSVHKEIDVIDESSYTVEGLLTDDEKSMYLEKQFSLGKIPLKAPTKELR